MLTQIINAGLEALRVIPKAAKSVVASWAEQCPHFSGFVVMVYGKLVGLPGSLVYGHLRVAAHGARATLGIEHCLVVGKAKTIPSDLLPLAVSGSGEPLPTAASAARLAYAPRPHLSANHLNREVAMRHVPFAVGA